VSVRSGGQALKKCWSGLALNECQSGLSQTVGGLEVAHIEKPDNLLTPTVHSSTLHNAHIHCTHLLIPLLSLGWRIGLI